MNVIVLNSDYSFHQTVDWKEGIVLVLKGAAEPLILSKKVVRTVSTQYVVPQVVRLVNYVKGLMKRQIHFSKNTLLLRDSYECQYCGHKVTSHTATIDHVLPRTLGGKTSFTNCVIACRVCNLHKGGKALKDTNMHLRKQPKDVSLVDFMKMKSNELGLPEILKGLQNQ